jgi:hypothetical protein
MSRNFKTPVILVAEKMTAFQKKYFILSAYDYSVFVRCVVWTKHIKHPALDMGGNCSQPENTSLRLSRVRQQDGCR